ncbi:MAG: tetratricopeptide repeat protein [Candidatus Eisenbacteria bacterium]|nr:tetratricopeptide repeat protein [Candidatus Eisenbacteria bacterium]
MRILLPVYFTLMLWPVGSVAQPDAGAGLDLDFARHLYAQGEYRLAAEELEQFALGHPDHPDAEEASFLAADCWVLLGDWTRARRSLETFVAANPVSHWSDQARFRLAATLFELGSYAEAESLYLKVGAGKGQGAGEAFYWAGEAAFRRGEFSRSSELLSRAAGVLPSGELRGWAVRRHAEALQRIGREDQARELLTGLAGGSDAQPEDLLSLARLQLEGGMAAAAERTLQTMANRWPGRGDSRLLREVKARSLWEQGKHRDAITLLSVHSGESPTLLAWMLLEEGQPVEAVRVLTPAMRYLEGFDRSEAAVTLASALGATGRPLAGDSLLAVETAGISDRVLLSRAVLLRAALQRESGDLDAATRTLDRGFRHLVTGDDSLEGYCLYADVASRQGRWDDATRLLLDARDHAGKPLERDLAFRALIAAYRAESWAKVERLAESLLEDSGDSIAARTSFWKAEALARQGRWTEAESAYTAALAGPLAMSERAEASFGRAWAWLSLERREEALEEFRRAAAHDPGAETAARAVVRAADVLMMLGNYDEAAASYRQATQMITRREIGDEALLGLGRALSLAGETDEAVAVLERLFRGSSTGPMADDALFEKGEALFRAGRFDDAEAQYRSIIDLQRDRETRDNALYRVGDCQYNRGEYPPARRTYLSVISGYPDSDLWAHAVQGALWAEMQSSGAPQALALCDSLLGWVQDGGKRGILTLAKADLLYGADRVDEALPLYRELNQPGSDLRAAWCLRSRPQEARRAFEELARRWPDAPEAAEGLYQAARLAREADPAGARHLLRTLLESYPSSDLRDAARFELGRTLREEPDSALAVWAHVARTGTGEWRDKALLAGAEVHLAAGRPESALAWLPQLLAQTSGGSPRAYWVAAEAEAARGDSAEARRLFLKLAYLFPEDSLAAPAGAVARTLAGAGTGAAR